MDGALLFGSNTMSLKEDIAKNIREWVKRTSDPAAKLPTLTRMAASDLTILEMAILNAQRREQELKNPIQSGETK